MIFNFSQSEYQLPFSIASFSGLPRKTVTCAQTYLHVLHLDLDALDVTEHAEQLVVAVQDAALLLQQLHQVAPLVHDLVLARLHRVLGMVVLQLQLLRHVVERVEAVALQAKLSNADNNRAVHVCRRTKINQDCT